MSSSMSEIVYEAKMTSTPSFNQAQAGLAWLHPTHVPLSQYTATLLHCWLVVWGSGVPGSDRWAEQERRRWHFSSAADWLQHCSTAEFSSVGMVKDKLRNQSGQAENAGPCWQIWLKWWSAAVSRIWGLHEQSAESWWMRLWVQEPNWMPSLVVSLL